MVVWGIYEDYEGRVSHSAVYILRMCWLNNCASRRTLVAEDLQIRTSAFEHFEATLKMLNESMGMCLPTSASAARVDGLPVDDTSN